MSAIKNLAARHSPRSRLIYVIDLLPLVLGFGILLLGGMRTGLWRRRGLAEPAWRRRLSRGGSAGGCQCSSRGRSPLYRAPVLHLVRTSMFLSMVGRSLPARLYRADPPRRHPGARELGVLLEMAALNIPHDGAAGDAVRDLFGT